MIIRGRRLASSSRNVCLIGKQKWCSQSPDNVRASKVAISYLKDKLKAWRDDALVLNSDYMHVYCAHIMNLIVNERLKKLYDNIVSVQNDVKYVRSSITRLKAFQIRVEQEKILGQNNQPSKGIEVLDYPTRQNIMLTTTLKFRLAFNRIKNEDKL